jgi:hypothetical protein
MVGTMLMPGDNGVHYNEIYLMQSIKAIMNF